MSDKRRVPLSRGLDLAKQLVWLLGSQCERIEIAGSIRRNRPDVGDVELVAIPKLEHGADLFGEASGEPRDLLDAAMNELLAAGTMLKRLDVNGRPRWGKRYKAAIYDGVALDLFCVLPPAQFGTIFLIRTGPAEFSHRLVTPRHKGGWMPEWLSEKDGALWYRGEIKPTPEEADVFQALALPYVEPEERTASWRPVGLGVRV